MSPLAQVTIEGLTDAELADDHSVEMALRMVADQVREGKYRGRLDLWPSDWIVRFAVQVPAHTR